MRDMRRNEGFNHGAVAGHDLHAPILLPQRKGAAFGDGNMQTVGKQFENGGIGDPGIGLQPRARLVGIEKQQ